MHQPWRHGTGLDTDAGILAAMPLGGAFDLFRFRGALATPQSATGIVHDTDRRQFLRDVQTDIAGHRTASDVKVTGLPAPGTRHYRRARLLPRLPDVHRCENTPRVMTHWELCGSHEALC